MSCSAQAPEEGDNTMWRLDVEQATLIISAGQGQLPRLLHYGARLPEEDCSALLAASVVGWPYGTTDAPTHAGLLPQAASCFGGYPALQVHADGRSIDAPLALNCVEQSDGHLCFCYANESLALDIHLHLHQSGVLRMYTHLRNHTQTTLQVDWLAAASLALPAMPLQVESYHGRWGAELQPRRSALDEATQVLENRRGRSSHQLFPGLFAGEPGFTSARGRCYALQLAWSGNFRLVAQRQVDASATLQAGVLYQPGEQRLAAGEQLQTPELLCSFGEGGNACAQRFHRYTRQQLLPPWTRRPRPVHSNSWEALYFDQDTQKLCALVDAAVAIGAERFVLDDGWFHGRRSDNAGLGDWWVDTTIFPDGLHPLVAHVRASGLQFGLWFEPEMVNPDSELYRQHPDWVLGHSGASMPMARQQWVLDIAKPEVSEYLYQRIASLVEEYAIDYIKWDMNRDFPAAGDAHSARAAAQPQALYALLQRLNQRFAHLEIETCASGGARCDLGILAHTGRVWISDNNDPVDRFGIHQIAAQFLPPEILGAHIGPARAHLTSRETPLPTRAVLAMTGQFGYELDPRGLDSAEAAQLRSFAQLYQQHRQWLAQSLFYRLEHLSPEILASAFVADDGSRALVALMAQCSLDGATSGQLYVPGLEAERRYRVQVLIADRAELARRNRVLPPWLDTARRVHGATLMTLGLALPVLCAHAALLILFERDDD